MTNRTLVLRSAAYHWRTNAAVVVGVAVAVSVLSGALVAGDSVRGSLRDLASSRLGRTEYVVSSTGFFRDALAERVAVSGVSAAPLVAAAGIVTAEASGRRAARVQIYGVDDRFWRFNGLPAPAGVQISPALARELGAKIGDVLLARLQKPSQIPVESLFGRKDDVGRTMRLDVAGVLPRDQLGEFVLRPQQAEVRAVFVPLRAVQRDLGVSGKVNTLVVNGGDESAIAGRVAAAVGLEDLDVKLGAASEPPAVTIDTSMGILSDALESAARRVAEARGLAVVPVFTYLANAIRKGDRQVPYSLITATDLSQLWDTSSLTAGLPAVALAKAGRSLGPQALGQALVLNDWAARELGAVPGDRIEIEYYLWDSSAGLTTHTVDFTLDRVVPIVGLAGDRRLAPEYPGITASTTLADWDPPFPLDLSRVRPIDEKYWDDHRTTPKAFIAFERGRELWTTRYGSTTSLRLLIPPGADAATVTADVSRDLRAALDPRAMGVALTPVRKQALDASVGATDFGEYFVYFSFFIVCSALLLAVLFFRLGVEQRLRQAGVLRAAGFSVAHIRRLLLAEAVALAVLGSALGAAGAVGYGWVVVYGLRTWWVGAVGTTLLTLHVSWTSLLAGVLGGVAASVICVVLSLRAVSRLSPRALLTAQSLDAGPAGVKPPRRAAIAGALFGLVGLGLLAAAVATGPLAAGLFFGAAGSLLVASLCLLSWRLRSRGTRAITGRGVVPLARLGFRSVAFRPSRAVLSAALIASAVFIIVSVDAFRRTGGDLTSDTRSGTGGFALLATSEVPLLQSPNDAAGREALVVNAPEFARTRFTRFRIREGDDASCMNLYRPTNPTIIAPEPGFAGSARFTFAASIAESEAERANPWLLLDKPLADGAIPVVADATSLQYALHQKVGDTWSIDTGGTRPLVIRFVGALADSVLQGEIVMSEASFIRAFPAVQGYRFFLIDAPGVATATDAAALAAVFERELAPFGFDAVTTTERLAAFHRVENTYLSTFQALGGLGLLLGTIGLAAVLFRNVLERRRELALLRAVGYDSRRVSILIVAEAAFLLGAGLVIGAVCAALAVAPAWLGRAGSMPGPGLALLLAGVAAAGLAASVVATRAAIRGNMLEALRTD